MLAAIKAELSLRQSYLEGMVHTIYFGGGTPSILDKRELADLLRACYDLFDISDTAEITMEANPDDLSPTRLAEFDDLGINRLSIGVQSFDPEVLQFLNRAHNQSQAVACIKNARQAAFDNISVDLIYGIPGRSHKQWRTDIRQLLALNPEHISAYSLTIEPDTAFGRWHEKGKLTPVSDDYAAEQFLILVEELEKYGYEQYEVSNFCRDAFYSRHNTSYWQQQPYLGIGPSAHSYNLVSRQFNVSNNAQYIRAINAHEIPATVEVLSDNDKVNDYLLTTLRTKWGANLNQLNLYNKLDMTYISQLIDQQLATLDHDHLILTRQGRLLADKISSDLFILDA